MIGQGDGTDTCLFYMGGGIIHMLTRARLEKSNSMAHDQDKMATKNRGFAILLPHVVGKPRGTSNLRCGQARSKIRSARGSYKELRPIKICPLPNQYKKILT